LRFAKLTTLIIVKPSEFDSVGTSRE